VCAVYIYGILKKNSNSFWEKYRALRQNIVQKSLTFCLKSFWEKYRALRQNIVQKSLTFCLKSFYKFKE